METLEIERSVRSIVAAVSSVPEDAPADADLYLELGMPSIQALALLQDLEQHFGITIPDDEFVDSTSITKLTHTLERLLKSHV